MSKKLPLAIQRNYTIKNVGNAWALSCIVCNQVWQLNKPEQSKSVHVGNVLHLLEHTATHPFPQDKEEDLKFARTSVAEFATEEPVPAPVSHVTFPMAHSLPTKKNPNSYRVEVTENVTKVSAFKDITYNKYRQVQKERDNYSIVLYAANQKHAGLVGKRLIQRYITVKQEK